jgi:hypothetical protein
MRQSWLFGQRGGKRDRGTRRGAVRCIVNEKLELIDQDVAKHMNAGGEFFQSRSEAHHYIHLEILRRAGRIRALPGLDHWRQVRFPLITVDPDGDKTKVADLILDFAYESHDGFVGGEALWVPRYEDVKPAGGHREDVYLLKRRWFEIQYGISIIEV